MSQFEKYQQSIKWVNLKRTKKNPNISSDYDLNNVKTTHIDTHKNAHNIWNRFYFQIDQ